jgi:hypothetical protein
MTVRLWWKWLTVTNMSLVHLKTVFFVKVFKSIIYQKVWLVAVAQLEHLPHFTKVKGLTPAAASASRENDDERYQKMASHSL